MPYAIAQNAPSIINTALSTQANQLSEKCVCVRERREDILEIGGRFDMCVDWLVFDHKMAGPHLPHYDEWIIACGSVFVTPSYQIYLFIYYLRHCVHLAIIEL